MPAPLLFLDVDDVFCLNNPYGGYDVARSPYECPADLWEKLFDAGCVQVLQAVLQEHRPRVVLTTSWLRFLDREGFEGVFARTGLQDITRALHERWEAPQMRGEMRCSAIARWLGEHQRGAGFAIMDDSLSGTGLRGSPFDSAGRVLWCEVGVGLTQAHVPHARRAFAARPAV